MSFLRTSYKRARAKETRSNDTKEKALTIAKTDCTYKNKKRLFSGEFFMVRYHYGLYSKFN